MKELKRKVLVTAYKSGDFFYIDFENGFISSYDDETENVELTDKELKLVKYICRNFNREVSNTELYEAYYGYRYDKDRAAKYEIEDKSKITKYMSTLRGKKLNKSKFTVGHIIGSNGNGAFQINTLENPFENCIDNPIANYIEKYQQPRFNNSSLRYDAENTLFCGRDEEWKLLVDFLNDKRELLWWAITGRGGSGKSRLAYELIKSVNSCNDIAINGNWKGIMVEWNGFYSYIRQFFNTMMDWNSTTGRNYLIVIDYVQLYEKEIAEFLQSMIRISIYDTKIRVLMIERVPNFQDQNSNKFEPLWYRTFKSGWNNVEWLNGTCYNKSFIHLMGIEEEDAINIVNSYVNNNNKSITEEECLKLTRYAKAENNGVINPLLLLCIVDTWIYKPKLYTRPEELSASIIWKQIIDKEKKEIIGFRDDEIISNALLEIHAIACITHSLTLDFWVINRLFLLKRFKIRYWAFQGLISSKLVQSKYVTLNEEHQSQLVAIEPDIIGEYFVHTILNDYSEEEYEELFNFLIEYNPIETRRFAWRYLSDFPFASSQHPGYRSLLSCVYKSVKKEVSSEITINSFDSIKEDRVFNHKGVKCEALLTFDSDTTKKSYIVYTDDTKDDDGNIRIYAESWNGKSEAAELYPIETEVEWKIIRAILDSLKHELSYLNEQ